MKRESGSGSNKPGRPLKKARRLNAWLIFLDESGLLMEAVRRLGLAGTELARAQCDTLRWKLLKIGAQIRVTVRRVWISLAEAYAYAALLAQVWAQLRALPSRC